MGWHCCSHGRDSELASASRSAIRTWCAHHIPRQTLANALVQVSLKLALHPGSHSTFLAGEQELPLTALPTSDSAQPHRYKRYELARRYSWYYTAVASAGAISGLLAGLITHNLDGVYGIAGWRWLFIIEGVGSSAVGCVVWFFMADYPSTTKWLTPEERILAAQRIAHDGIGATQGTEEQIKEWTALKMTVCDWKVWALALIYALITGAQVCRSPCP